MSPRPSTLRRLLLALLAGALAAPLVAALSPPPGDADHGRRIFLQNCALCHATGQEHRPLAGQGPLLAGIYGRPAASLPNFSYTKALRNSGLVWDAGTLNEFLAHPWSTVPGTSMVVSVALASDRRDLIAYLATLAALSPEAESAATAAPAITGSQAGNWTSDAPGVIHSVTVESLPPPYATAAAGNGPVTVDRPPGAKLSVPGGFSVRLFASGLEAPRLLQVAPNGDLFIAETSAGRIRVLRAADGADAPSQDSIFADGLRGPFGIAFYPAGDDPQWVYVGNLNSVVRFPYRNGDLTARGPAQVIVPRLANSTGGHTTRALAFSADGRRLFISVGSGSNVAEEMEKKSPEEIRDWQATHALGAAWGWEEHRADVLVTDPEGHEPLRVFATGIRNPVTIVVQPGTGELWAATNERDNLGDDLVPDYVTRVQEGHFYGWPWYYLGDHEDPRHAGERPDLLGRVTVPDVLFQSHSAPLEMTFYTAVSGPAAFPAEYRGDIFVALHGSWNRTIRTGSKVVRIRVRNGVPENAYEDFLVGFVVDNHSVWGRPVGVAVAHDGALLVSDDAGGTLWRIAYGEP